MWKEVPLDKLPKSMAERALWAREEFIKNPQNSQIDDETLVWCKSPDGLWYSIAGNYSADSPEQKRVKKDEREKEYKNRMASAEEMAEEQYKNIVYQSKIRLQVLERDKYTCQICGDEANTKLHVHHILKRIEGGTDHFDNLLTVCPKCHRKIDTKLYNPNWK